MFYKNEKNNNDIIMKYIIAIIGLGRLGKSISDVLNQMDHCIHYLTRHNKHEWGKILRQSDMCIDCTLPDSSLEIAYQCIRSRVRFIERITGKLFHKIEYIFC